MYEMNHQSMIQDVWGWCTGMTQRHRTGREIHFKTNNHTLKHDGLKNGDRQRILSLSKTRKIQETPRKLQP